MLLKRYPGEAIYLFLQICIEHILDPAHRGHKAVEEVTAAQGTCSPVKK